MEDVEYGWDDFWAGLFRIRHRSSIQGIREYDKMIVEFCIDVLKLEKGKTILDIACGAGDHCIEFAKRDLDVTGFDISKSLIDFAQKQTQEQGLQIKFFEGDMRQIDFAQCFDAAVLLSHSFGFFNHDENRSVLDGSYAALVEGGMLLLDLINPYNIPRFQRTWTKLTGGVLLSEPHSLDAQAGVLRGSPATFIDTENDRIIHMNEDALSNNDIRMYTALEIRQMLDEVGFSRVEFYGRNKLPRMPYSVNSDRMVVVAKK